MRTPMRAKAYPGEDPDTLPRPGARCSRRSCTCSGPTAGALPAAASTRSRSLRARVGRRRGRGRAPDARCRRARAPPSAQQRVELRAFELARAPARQVARQRDRCPSSPASCG
ncbi:MAG: hypothetical protein MZV65_49210 [Chromatiales bacterium]|nr:hypothetical protein [Chromatiales bacterium]